MRIVFMGTPEFAVPTLRAVNEAGYDIAGVFCQPDKPRGRGGKVTFCPVKEAAIELSLPVFQPVKMRSPEGLETLKSLNPDVVVTAAYGQILSKANLSVPRLGTINVHASLLPKYRGPAPIQWAIINGEEYSGVTTMFTDIGVDTGDILLSESVPTGDLTYGELQEELARTGAEVLLSTLELLKKDQLTRTPQNPAEATHHPMLTKEHGQIDFTKTAKDIVNLVRGVNPWPGAYTNMQSGALKVWKASASNYNSSDLFKPGKVAVSSQKDGLHVMCGDSQNPELIEFVEIQAPGGKRMSAKDYLRGKAIPAGTLLSSGGEAGEALGLR